MKEFTKNEAQLGFVLSHELSHFILGHTKELLMFEAIVKVAVLSMVSVIDISGGLGSFAYELLVPYIGALIGKSFSREQETTADHLGLRIATVSRWARCLYYLMMLSVESLLQA